MGHHWSLGVGSDDSPESFSPLKDVHVVATFQAIEAGAGSERGIGWNWLLQISDHVGRVTAVVPRDVRDGLLGGNLPSNVRVASVGERSRTHTRGPVPDYYGDYVGFNDGARRLTASLRCDISHQVTLGTPYWGSSLGWTRAPRLLGPVGVSTGAPFWTWPQLGIRGGAEEVTRRALKGWTLPPIYANRAIDAADFILAADARTLRMATSRGRLASVMPQDGAHPVDVTEIVPFEQRQDLVWAGSLIPRKGASLALCAFAEALPQLPQSTRLIFFGGGSQLGEMHALTVQQNVGHRVEFAGHVERSELLGHLGRATALVFSSFRDTFGGVVLEAAERGTPIVLSSHRGLSGLRRWLPDGAAWMAQGNSAPSMRTALAREMIKAVRADRAGWGARSQEAYAFACRNDWRLRGEAMASIYSELLLR